MHGRPRRGSLPYRRYAQRLAAVGAFGVLAGRLHAVLRKTVHHARPVQRATDAAVRIGPERLHPGRKTENARTSSHRILFATARTIVRILLGHGRARNGQAAGHIRRAQAYANSPAKTSDYESARPCDRRGAGISVLAILLLAVQKDHRPDARPLSDVLLTVYAVNIFSAVGPRTAAFVVSRSGTFIGCGTEAPVYIADDR